MKILIVECTAEELRANRTVLDTFNEALSSFTRPMFGADFDISKVQSEQPEQEEEDDGGEF